MLSGTASDALRPYRFSPEVTLQGNWSKCLVRKNDGVYLYKANDGDLREVEISKFGQMLGLAIVKYWAEDYEDVPCTVCKILSSDPISGLQQRKLEKMRYLSSILNSLPQCKHLIIL